MEPLRGGYFISLVVHSIHLAFYIFLFKNGLLLCSQVYMNVEQFIISKCLVLCLATFSKLLSKVQGTSRLSEVGSISFYLITRIYSRLGYLAWIHVEERFKGQAIFIIRSIHYSKYWRKFYCIHTSQQFTSQRLDGPATALKQQYYKAK